MKNDATEKIVMLQSSERCFVYGLLGLLPGIGIPFAVMALWMGGRARVREKRFWNAAAPYRTLGIICAALGLIVWFFVAAMVTYNASATNDDGGMSCYDGGGD
ncbi:MAG TPA: hypothetical protein VMH87_13680 [Pseudomonadales bacterium]|nr:hypothetical protein [Pseudomonadales bacterium]